MRHFRNFLYLVVGFFLAVNITFAFAATESTPATLATSAKTTQYFVKGNNTGSRLNSTDYATASEAGAAGLSASNCTTMNSGDACTYTGSAAGPGCAGSPSYGNYVTANAKRTSDNAVLCVSTGFAPSDKFVVASEVACPTGYAWNASANRCEKYTCDTANGWVGPTAVNGVMMCSRDSCMSKKDQYSSGWVKVPQGGAIPSGKYCNGGCEINSVLSVGDEMLLSKGYDWWPMGQTYTGASCTAGSSEQPVEPTAPAKPPKTPPCASGEGVMTSSSGKVSCVPPGIDSASVPKVENKKKTETYPDNSTKTTTETKTTDPNTGATHTSTSTTTTGGQSGTAGTTTTSENKSTNVSGTGTGADGEGDCDPSTQACSGKPGTFGDNDGLYEKKYENGLSGVLTEKYNAMKSTPIFGVVGQLAPSNLANGGQCPSWSFGGSINSKINLGGMTLAPPCYVFDAVRAILLITSLLLARRLIFGG